MPEFPPAIYLKAAEALERELLSGRDYLMALDSDEALARAVLDAVAEDLGAVVAGKILAHMEGHGPRTAGASWQQPWRRHFEVAARIASRAFMDDDDLLAAVAREIKAGNAVICTGPEVPAVPGGGAMMPVDLRCPSCGAGPGQPCRSKSGRTQWGRFHKARPNAPGFSGRNAEGKQLCVRCERWKFPAIHSCPGVPQRAPEDGDREH